MFLRTRIEITGVVQGVGFRPFVYNLAHRHRLAGYCQNTSEGLLIEVEGEAVERFIHELQTQAPSHSRIDTLTSSTVERDEACTGFRIVESSSRPAGFALVSPDIATCPDCLRELFDPTDRRYRYPFINCTNCGPRYSIVRNIPYDRTRTTMAAFAMCPACEAEYHNPADRRFHAQPNACPECGPRLELGVVNSAYSASSEGELEASVELLSRGAIGAIKGLGGFHLACDAANRAAVGRLREWKRRSNKPFAIMAPDVEVIKQFCVVSEEEQRWLEGSVRPIVLLEKLDSTPLADAVAPGQGTYGVMLPYTPLHALLLSSGNFTALVMTSGNLAEEPIAIDNEEAVKRLTVADFFLLHDRDIHMRVDDSIVSSEPQFSIIRRARGFVPETIDLGEEMEDILACGAELKNTFCLTRGRYAILSQHIGDLQNMEALDFFGETLVNLVKTFRVNPQLVAHDLHPDYMSTNFAAEYAGRVAIPAERIVAVQHHHAHVASCMAEHGLRGQVLGVAFDGTGYGEDGRVWGGEFLLATRREFVRKAHLPYVPMPGGDKAAIEPWRMTLSWLDHALGDDAEKLCPRFFGRHDRRITNVIAGMVKRGASPLTSSAGRLFDAVSSLLGLVDVNTYEGEAATTLETIARTAVKTAEKPYRYIISDLLGIDLRPLIAGIVDDMGAGCDAATIAFRFHSTLAGLILDVARLVREDAGTTVVVLSGGVFQNRLLVGMVRERLDDDGFTVWTHQKVPSGDGGISLGQAVVAWERIKRG